jgi:hypothetical protein
MGHYVTHRHMYKTHPVVRFNRQAVFYFNAIRTDQPPSPTKKSASLYDFNGQCTKLCKPGQALYINENKIRSFRSEGKIDTYTFKLCTPHHTTPHHTQKKTTFQNVLY